MSNRSRFILAAAALSLVLMYFFPIWKISLDAPQYPEGIGLEIWVDTVKGQKKHDLANVNNLNHYIGMKRIEPDSIPELDLMPGIIGVLIGLGLLAALVGKRWLLYTWAGLFLIICLVGLVDFYLWEYDYGHNLDHENAIIKIPGMSYQPPLLGSKQLLNFVATSWPALGGIVAFLSLGTGMWLSWTEYRQAPRSVEIPVQVMVPLLAMASFLSAGCEPAPRAMVAGVDRCEHCMMGFSDTRFGGQLVLDTGKVLVFDSIECMAEYLNEQDEAPSIHSTWVVNYVQPGMLISIDDALLVRSMELHSPMGMNLAALSHEQLLEIVNDFEVLTWEKVREMVGGRQPITHTHPAHKSIAPAGM